MRQLRNRRHRGVNVRLTDRDRHVFEALGRFRLARTRDLQLTCFRGIHPTTAGLRIRKLFDAGFLDVHSGRIGEENVYVLGRAAKDWRLGPVPRGNLQHHLAIVHAWAILAANVPESLLLERSLPDWELREDAPHLEVIPDLFMVLSGKALAVEVDLGTEALPVLRRKLDAYRSLDRLFGYPFAVSVMAERRIPDVHCWSASDGPASCYDLLLGQQ